MTISTAIRFAAFLGKTTIHSPLRAHQLLLGCADAAIPGTGLPTPLKHTAWAAIAQHFTSSLWLDPLSGHLTVSGASPST